MSGGYEALAAKARAMYGKRLRADELEQISRMGRVQDVLSQLRQQPGWSQAVQVLPEGTVLTRAWLEEALRGQLRRECLRLSAFIPQEDRALMDFPILRVELERILGALRRLHARQYKRAEALPVGYAARARADLKALDCCEDFAGLVEAARGSIYHDALARQRQGDALPDYGVTEALLWSVYYRYMLRLVRLRYEGDTRKLLEQSIGGQVDVLNILHILRMKRYFPHEDNYLPVLLPYHYKLSVEQVRAMCAASGHQAVLDLVQATPYGRMFRGAGPGELGTLYRSALYRLSRRQLRMGKPSVYTAVAYLNLREIELQALVSAVEASKYHQELDPALLRILAD